MKVLVKIKIDCGRCGNLKGTIICEEKELDAIDGKDIHFGEVMGKHSDVIACFSKSNCEIISKDQEKIDWLYGLVGATVGGLNPLHYDVVEEEWDDEDE